MSECTFKRKLFVGGLSKLTAEDRLRSYFENFGTVESVNIVKDEYGITRGFGFVVLKKEETVDLILNRIHVLDRKQLDLRLASAPVDYGIPENVMKRLQVGELEIFVGGLAREVVESDIKAVLSQFGQVSEVTVARNRDGSSKGCAFVKFLSVGHPDKLFNDTIFIRGRRADIRPPARNKGRSG